MQQQRGRAQWPSCGGGGGAQGLLPAAGSLSGHSASAGSSDALVLFPFQELTHQQRPRWPSRADSHCGRQAAGERGCPARTRTRAHARTQTDLLRFVEPVLVTVGEVEAGQLLGLGDLVQSSLQLQVTGPLRGAQRRYYTVITSPAGSGPALLFFQNVTMRRFQCHILEFGHSSPGMVLSIPPK